MKKFVILALSTLLLLGSMAGCRKNVGNETTGNTHSSTQSTTKPTTKPTETTRHTEPSTQTTTRPTDGTMLPGTDGTEEDTQGRMRRPRY